LVAHCDEWANLGSNPHGAGRFAAAIEAYLHLTAVQAAVVAPGGSPTDHLPELTPEAVLPARVAAELANYRAIGVTHLLLPAVDPRSVASRDSGGGGYVLATIGVEGSELTEEAAGLCAPQRQLLCTLSNVKWWITARWVA
jgi:hypothetical protein